MTGTHHIIFSIGFALLGAQLVERGVEVGEIQEHGREVTYASFSDPD